MVVVVTGGVGGATDVGSLNRGIGISDPAADLQTQTQMSPKASTAAAIGIHRHMENHRLN